MSRRRNPEATKAGERPTLDELGARLHSRAETALQVTPVEAVRAGREGA